MISMKWRADSENSENSALDTIIVSHKIYGKKLFFHRFDFTSSDSPLKQPTGIPGIRILKISGHRQKIGYSTRVRKFPTSEFGLESFRKFPEISKESFRKFP